MNKTQDTLIISIKMSEYPEIGPGVLHHKIMEAMAKIDLAFQNKVIKSSSQWGDYEEVNKY